MKRNDLVEIKNSKIEELIKKVTLLKKELTGLVMERNMNKVKDLKSIAKKRKDIAQIMTVIGQKKLLGQLENSINEVKKGEK